MNSSAPRWRPRKGAAGELVGRGASPHLTPCLRGAGALLADCNSDCRATPHRLRKNVK